MWACPVHAPGPAGRIASVAATEAFELMILQTSYSAWANTMLCLLVAKAGSADCTEDVINDPRTDQTRPVWCRTGAPARITRKGCCLGAGSDRADA